MSRLHTRQEKRVGVVNLKNKLLRHLKVKFIKGMLIFIIIIIICNFNLFGHSSQINFSEQPMRVKNTTKHVSVIETYTKSVAEVKKKALE